MDTDYNAAQFWLGLTNTIGWVSVGVYSWWSNRNKATAGAIAAIAHDGHELAGAIRADLGAHERRIAEVEHQVGERLRSGDLKELYERLGQLNREMGEFSARLAAANQQLALHQEYLLNQGHG